MLLIVTSDLSIKPSRKNEVGEMILGKDSLLVHNSIISIIVSVYNVELYIEKCVDSLFGQSYRYIEYILVTVKICQQIPQYGLVFTYFSHTKWQMLSYLI
jgi:hypothetical protein